MDQISKSIEIIRLSKQDEYFIVQLAVDGVLAVPMEIHASARETYKSESSWLQYLENSARSLIQVYGDARQPRSIEMYDPSLAGVA